MIHGISNSVTAVHTHHNAQQNHAVQKAASEESKANFEEKNESAAVERSEKANNGVGSIVDKFA